MGSVNEVLQEVERNNIKGQMTYREERQARAGA